MFCSHTRTYTGSALAATGSADPADWENSIFIGTNQTPLISMASGAFTWLAGWLAAAAAAAAAGGGQRRAARVGK